MISTRMSFLFQSLALLTCVALITLLPSLHFMPKTIIWFHDGQRLLELIILGFVLLSLIFINDNSCSIGSTSKITCYAFFTLIILTCLSTSLSASPRHAVVEVSLFSGLFFLALMIARLYYENKEVFIKRLIYVLWVGILLYMVSFYVGYITAVIFKTPLKWPLPFTGFSNIRSFNQYQLWSLGLIALPILAFDLKNTARRCLQIALVFWWVLLFYSSSRGVLLAWVVSATLTAIIYRKSAFPFLRLQLMLIGAGYFTYYLLFRIIPKLNESTLITGTVLRETVNDRIGLWSQALTLAAESPILGVGPMHFAWHYPTSAHPHNSVLQLAAEFGIPATIILLTLAGYGVYCWLKKFNVTQLETSNNLDKNISVILFFTLITNSTYSFVDGVIVMPISQVMMFSVIGLLIGHYAYHTKPLLQDDHTQTKGKFKFMAIFALVTFVALIWSAMPEIMQGLSGSEKGFSTEQSAIGPRLWRQIY